MQDQLGYMKLMSMVSANIVEDSEKKLKQVIISVFVKN